MTESPLIGRIAKAYRGYESLPKDRREGIVVGVALGSGGHAWQLLVLMPSGKLLSVGIVDVVIE